MLKRNPVNLSRSLFSLLGILFVFTCSANDNQQNRYVNRYASEQYYHLAKELYDYETTLNEKLFETISKHCPKCEAEKRISYIHYKDALAILDTSLANDKSNSKALYLRGQIFWLLSYEGFGHYNKNNIGEAKRNLESAVRYETDPKVLKDIKNLLGKIEKVEAGSQKKL